MTRNYHMILESQLGPRPGELAVECDGFHILGTLSMLGFDNPVQGEWLDGTTMRLRHPLKSVMSELVCESVLQIRQRRVTGVAYTSKGNMNWHGEEVILPETGI